ncbi:MAG: RsmB/NOP family class I SAM-dependent RNA methyltransferase [Promethearchaeota archaeon]
MVNLNQLKELILAIQSEILKYNTQNDQYQQNRPNIKNPYLKHYISEIQRYKTALNFSIKKTLRRFPLEIQFPELEAIIIYCTYRIQKENASYRTLIEELSQLRISQKEKNEISRFLVNITKFSWEKALKGKNPEEKLSIQASIPSFIINQLKSVMNLPKIKSEIDALNSNATQGELSFWIYNFFDENFINEVFRDLKRNKIQFIQDNNIPFLFTIPLSQKGKLIQSKSYLERKLFIQEKPSVAAIIALDPQLGDLILDLSAAPGMKTLLIDAMSRHRAIIVANDLRFDRLQFLNSLNTINLRSKVNILNGDGLNLPFRDNILFDKILLDAPCTGSGTFANNPELKWRQKPSFLHRNMQLQLELIQKSKELLKPGGIIVYSTCSLYPEEGELQIRQHLHDFEPMKLPYWIPKSYNLNFPNVEKQKSRSQGRFYPYENGTIGFYIAKYRKPEN